MSSAPITAAITATALAGVRAEASGVAEIVELTDELDLDTVDFLVPTAGDRGIVPRLKGVQRLQVVQVLSAGTDWIEAAIPPQARLCSARGARDAPVAEWVVGALLGASSRLLAQARRRDWSDRRPVTDLGGSTVVIVGMGSIGRRVAAYLAPMEVNVIGIASRARDGLSGPEALGELLPQADSVVVLAPLTEATRGLIGAAELAALRDGAVLVNAGRGPVVDTAALLAELATGRLHAVLDVTDPEPLPDDHPLWTAPGTLAITPHVAGDSAAGGERAARLAGRQLARFAAGQPLDNVVLSVPRCS